jgi:hypothetical protein
MALRDVRTAIADIMVIRTAYMYSYAHNTSNSQGAYRPVQTYKAELIKTEPL